MASLYFPSEFVLPWPVPSEWAIVVIYPRLPLSPTMAPAIGLTSASRTIPVSEARTRGGSPPRQRPARQQHSRTGHRRTIIRTIPFYYSASPFSYYHGVALISMMHLGLRLGERRRRVDEQNHPAGVSPWAWPISEKK